MAGFFASERHQLLRSPSQPFHVSDAVALSDMTATVTELTEDGQLKAVEFRFDSPLESPKWLWVRGEGIRLAEWSPPKVGESVVGQAGL